MPHDNEKTICEICEKEHERYFRDENARATWQTVSASMRSDLVATVSESGLVCRLGPCADTWFERAAKKTLDEIKRVRAAVEATQLEQKRILEASPDYKKALEAKAGSGG